MAQLGSNIYMTRQGTGDLVQLNQDGTFNHAVVGEMPAATGLAADPFTGHLFVSTLGNNVIWDVDPTTMTNRDSSTSPPTGSRSRPTARCCTR